MANITLLGASYTDVPAVDLPQTGGGTVRFYENGGGGRVSTIKQSFHDNHARRNLRIDGERRRFRTCG